MKNFSPDEAIDIASRLKIKAVCQKSDRIKVKLLAKARTILNNALAQNQNHSTLHYVLGLCWYWENEWTDKAKEQMQHHFSTAIQLNPTNQYAKLYLGHFYFDEARYAEALKLFREIDNTYFEGLDQKWRVLKNHELMICCRLYLNANEVTFEEIENLCEEYENTKSIDAPVPQEIVVCLARLINEPIELKHAAQRVLLMVKRTDNEKVQSIMSELKFLYALVET